MSIDVRKHLEAIVDALDVADREATDDEILEEARAEGVDTALQAARMKSALLDAVQSFKQRRLREAQAAYKRESAALEQRSQAYRIPTSPEAKRELFGAIVARQPQYASMYTTQHREFQDLTDADIESYLEELAELGILDDFSNDADR